MQEKKKDFSIVTELPKTLATLEQLQRIYQRYAFATAHVKGQRVLEIGCGGGQGIGLLVDSGAKSVTGVDIDENNVKMAQATYADEVKVTVIHGDIAHMDFEAGAFDCILMFEVVYYLEDAAEVLSKCRSLLSDRGVLILQTVNCDWPGFYPSPYSTRYFNAYELLDLLRGTGFAARFYRAFPVGKDATTKTKILSLLNQVANKLHMIPRTMKGKALLKKILFGEMVRMPSRFHEGLCHYVEPVPFGPSSYDPQFKVLIGVGEKLPRQQAGTPDGPDFDR